MQFLRTMGSNASQSLSALYKTTIACLLLYCISLYIVVPQIMVACLVFEHIWPWCPCGTSLPGLTPMEADIAGVQVH